MLKENEVGHILYTKTKDDMPEVTDRQIIPTHIPKCNIKAIDVSSLDEADRGVVAKMHAEYQGYYKVKLKTIFSFEEWIEQTYPGTDLPELKYRTFKMDNIQIV